MYADQLTKHWNKWVQRVLKLHLIYQMERVFCCHRCPEPSVYFFFHRMYMSLLIPDMFRFEDNPIEKFLHILPFQIPLNPIQMMFDFLRFFEENLDIQ